eukprot:COSAG02_NODE_27081_length_617_cov_1.077220_2_plen_35_part_01
MLESLGENLTPEELRAQMAEVDADESAGLDFEEFA